jgi:hypothetical protein
MEKKQSIERKKAIRASGLLFSICIAGAATFFGCPSNSPVAPTTTTYQLTVTAGAGGAVSAPTTSPVTVNKGAATIITGLSNTGFHFAKWTVISGAATIADSTMASTTVILSSGNAAVQANFATTVPTYQLTIIAGTGGTITTPSSSPVSIPLNQATVVTAHASAGYAFSEWTDTSGNAIITYKNSASTTVALAAGNAVLQANFIQVTSGLTPINIGAFEKENGANYSYYLGTWTSIPDFSSLTPDSTGPCDSIDINAIPHRANNFGAVFSGYFTVGIDGNYTFYVNSTDASALYINDSLILSSDGIHAAAVENSVVVNLSHGSYLLEVRYLNAGSVASLNVSYECQDFGLPRGTINTDIISRPSTAPVPKILIKTPVGGETFHLGDTIHVNWSYRYARAQVFATISTDSGRSFSNICLLAIPPSDSSYNWKIPADSLSFISQSVFIKVEEYPPYNKFGQSNIFSIVP